MVTFDRQELPAMIGRKVKIISYGMGPGVRLAGDRPALEPFKIVYTGVVAGYAGNHIGRSDAELYLFLAGMGDIWLNNPERTTAIKVYRPVWWHNALAWLGLVRHR